MSRHASFRTVWRQPSIRALTVVFVVLAVTAALALDLRFRANRRLARTDEDFVHAFGRESLSRVQASLKSGPELPRRMSEAAASVGLDPKESQRMALAAMKGSAPAELTGWHDRCETLLQVIDRARRSAGNQKADAQRSQAWRDLSPATKSVPVINSVQACGLAAAARGEREMALVAVEVLGALARSLQQWPLRLSLLVGAHAEKSQLGLVERLHERADRAELQRLGAALSPEDLRARQRDAVAGEMLYARETWRRVTQDRESPLLVWYLEPLVADAFMVELTRFMRGDPKPSSWLDFELARSLGSRPQLEHERARLDDLSARRVAAGRMITASKPIK
jgi:hypothetical protein